MCFDGPEVGSASFLNDGSFPPAGLREESNDGRLLDELPGVGVNDLAGPAVGSESLVSGVDLFTGVEAVGV